MCLAVALAVLPPLSLSWSSMVTLLCNMALLLLRLDQLHRCWAQARHAASHPANACTTTTNDHGDVEAGVRPAALPCHPVAPPSPLPSTVCSWTTLAPACLDCWCVGSSGAAVASTLLSSFSRDTDAGVVLFGATVAAVLVLSAVAAWPLCLECTACAVSNTALDADDRAHERCGVSRVTVVRVGHQHTPPRTRRIADADSTPSRSSGASSGVRSWLDAGVVVETQGEASPSVPFRGCDVERELERLARDAAVDTPPRDTAARIGVVTPWATTPPRSMHSERGSGLRAFRGCDDSLPSHGGNGRTPTSALPSGRVGYRPTHASGAPPAPRTPLTVINMMALDRELDDGDAAARAALARWNSGVAALGAAAPGRGSRFGDDHGDVVDVSLERELAEGDLVAARSVVHAREVLQVPSPVGPFPTRLRVPAPAATWLRRPARVALGGSGGGGSGSGSDSDDGCAVDDIDAVETLYSAV